MKQLYTPAELYEMYVEWDEMYFARTIEPSAIVEMDDTEIALFVVNQLDGSDPDVNRYPLDCDGLIDAFAVSHSIQAEARRILEGHYNV